MEKSNKNQGFSSFDFFTMTASMAVIIAISAPIIKKNLEVGNIDRAQREARNLAFELLRDGQFQKLRVASQGTSKKPDRAIASAEKDDSWSGEVGMDPWGKPYKFRFLRNTQGMPVQIAVWSQGPDKLRPTHEQKVEVLQVNGQEQLKLDPDYVVTQVPLR